MNYNQAIKSVSEQITIKQKVDKLRSDINMYLSEIDILNATIKSIQKYQCKHPNAKSFKSGDYSGDTYMVFNCPDCGLQTEE